MTDASQLYLRRCNDQPAGGITVTRDTVESVLALALLAAVDVRGDLETELRIRLPAGRPWEVEAGGTVERTFTFVPLRTSRHRAPVGQQGD
jgi:hypothetical protein